MTTGNIERSLSVAGRRLDAVELPGDPLKRPLVWLLEGLGSSAVARLPASAAGRDRPSDHRGRRRDRRRADLPGALWEVSITRVEDGKLVAVGRLPLQNLPPPEASPNS
jgi:hypothetical protein